MNLPVIISQIGKSSPASNITKTINLKLKEGEIGYVIGMFFDLDKKKICFKPIKEFSNDDCCENYYFGNNAARAAQYYLTRDIKAAKYLLQNTLSDLVYTFKKYNFNTDATELCRLIYELERKGLVELSEKSGEGRVNINLLDTLNNDIEIVFNGKEIEITNDRKKIDIERLIKLCVNSGNPKDRVAMIVPIILKDEKEINLSKHEDYIELYRKVQGLDKIEKNTKENLKLCYICNQYKSDVNEKLKFSRTDLTQIFVTTTKNYTNFNDDYKHEKNYGMCTECYNNINIGNLCIKDDFTSKICGENVIILPEGHTNDFDYKYLKLSKEEADIIFNNKKRREILKGIEDASYYDEVKGYNINFIFYESDGNSISIKETFEDAPLSRLKCLDQRFIDKQNQMKNFIKFFSLGSIYHIIPINTNRNGEQLNISRVLSLYRALLKREKIERRILYNYCCEALDKGLNQMNADKIRNFENLGLNYYKLNLSDDLFIKDIVYKYLILMQVCDDLNLSNKKYFNKKGCENMQKQVRFIEDNPSEKDELELNEEKLNGEEENQNTKISLKEYTEKIENDILRVENFFENNGFQNDARAIFYLGMLIKRISYKQAQKDHKSKPILNKISFSGMNIREINRLYGDVLEKLKQYRILDGFSEAYLNRYHYYYGSINNHWKLNEQENIFYLMAGYSFKIGAFKDEN